MVKQFFCYAVKSTVSANSKLTPQINFSDQSDFILTEIRQTDHAAGDIRVGFQYSAGDQFSNISLDSSLFSEGFNGIKFFEKIIIPANTQLQVEIENTTAGSLTHEVQLWGYKVPKGGY